MAMTGESIASTNHEYALFPVHVGEQIYASAVLGAPLPPTETMLPEAMDHLKIHPYRLNQTLPPYDWWRAINPETGTYYNESDFDDLNTAQIQAPVYAQACRILDNADGSNQFPAQLTDCDTDNITDDEWLYVKNRDPNFFAMKGDIVWCVETDESDLIAVLGGRKSIEGIIFSSSDKSDDILTAPTDCEHSEVVLLGRPAPNATAVLSAWTECVPNTYESMDIEVYYSCRIARAGGIWVYESIGCEQLRDQSTSPDTEIFGEFDSRARYNELYPSYYSQDLNDQGD